MFERDYNLKITMRILLEKFHNKITNKGAHFRSEMKLWYNFQERKLNNGNEEIPAASKTRKTVDGKPVFTLEDPQMALLKL